MLWIEIQVGWVAGFILDMVVLLQWKEIRKMCEESLTCIQLLEAELDKAKYLLKTL
jgi:hypothetical protein